MTNTPNNVIRFMFYFLLLTSAIIISRVNAAETRDYAFIIAAGADIPFSNGINEISPVVYISWFNYLSDQKNIYSDLAASTTTVSQELGFICENLIAGLKPIWGHTVYGAYADYDRGYTSSHNEITGSFAGAEIFFKYQMNDFFHADFVYLPDYHWYATEDSARMEEPDPHWEQNARINLRFKNLTEKNLGIVKHGFEIKFQ